MAKKTLLLLPKEGGTLSQPMLGGHQRAGVRSTNIGVTAQGKEVVPPSVSVRLDEPQLVSRVTVDQDEDGNFYITLEE